MAKSKPQETKPEEGSGSDTESKSSGQKLAKFVGPGSHVTIRRISAKDFREAGAPEDFGAQEWSAKNNHTVDVSDWPQAAVDLVAAQPDFKITEG